MIGVEVRLHNGPTPLSNISSIQALWWDTIEPVDMSWPTGRSEAATVDENGYLKLNLTNVTKLDIGEIGFLMLYKKDAVNHESSLIFASKLPISDITTGVDMYYYDYPAIDPNFNLDFANGQYVEGTLSRASVATFVNSVGLVKTAAANIARLDYDSKGACKGLLLESEKTNLLSYSEDLTNNAWTKTATTISGDNLISPDGTQDADRVVETSATGEHRIERSFTPTTSTTYTFSVFLKKAERGFAFVGFTGGSMATTFISVNLTTGVVTNAIGTPVSSAITEYTDSWFRVSITLTSTGTTASNVQVILSSDGIWANRSYAGNTANGLSVWGAQLETNAFPTSYIPTTTASLLRNSETLTLSTTSFSRPDEFTYILEFYPIARTEVIFSLSNVIEVKYNGNNVEVVVTSGSIQAQLSLGVMTLNTLNKIAFRIQKDLIGACLNGGTVFTDTSANIPTFSQMILGGDNIFRNVVHYTTGLSDAELRMVSK